MIMVDYLGNEAWRLDFKEPVQATPAVGDVNGDGRAEIVTATVAGEIVVLSGKGKEKRRHPLTGRVVDWMSPCLADQGRRSVWP